MNRLIGGISGSGRGWGVLAMLLTLLPVAAGAQQPERDWDKISWARKDYFLKDTQRGIGEFVTTVEQYHLDRGFWEAWEAGDWIFVTSQLKYVLGAVPNHPRGLYLMGALAKKVKKYDLPLSYFEKAIKLFPQYAQTHAQYGAYLVSIGLIPVGVKELEQALALDPNQPLAKATLATVQRAESDRTALREIENPGQLLDFTGDLPPPRPGSIPTVGP